MIACRGKLDLWALGPLKSRHIGNAEVWGTVDNFSRVLKTKKLRERCNAFHLCRGTSFAYSAAPAYQEPCQRLA